MKRFAILVCLLTAFVTVYSQKSIGNWEGNIEMGNISLPIEFHFYLDSTGFVAGKWASPKQNARNLSFSHIEQKEDSLLLEMSSFNSSYKGEFINADSLSGFWMQNGAKLPLNFKRTAINSAASQKEKIYPNEKEISITSAAGTPLSGTLLSKNNEQKIALIIAGSGPTDRNGNNPLGVDADSYKLLARALDSQNIASFRFDKRGIAKSSIPNLDEKEIVFEDFIKDAEKIFDFLHDSLGFKHVYVIGHSEGSLVGMVAAEKKNADGFVSVAGAGRPIDVVINEQLAGADDSVKTKAAYIFSQLKMGKEVDQKHVPGPLLSVFRESIQPYMMSWLKYDPQKEIAKLKCPVLILQGSCDAQVSVKDAELLHSANKKSSLKIIPSMSHTLKDAGKNCEQQQKTYSDNKIPLDPTFVESISNFIEKN
jgi:pimeloyl-ACP methyl ester carboxylesterase